MSEAAYEKKQYVLGSGVTLNPLEAGQAKQAGEVLASISPWADIGYPAEGLEQYLSFDDASAYKYAILYNDQMAGVVCVRYPWMKGPYLELLGLYPKFQGQKIGSRVLAWFEAQGQGHSRNLWLVASDFNAKGIQFYRHNGFEEIAKLDDMSEDGVHDILMRKKLF